MNRGWQVYIRPRKDLRGPSFRQRQQTTKRAPATSPWLNSSCDRANDAPVCFDNLARDGQAEAGILAKALVGPVGIEALEDALESMGGYARPVIVDDDLDTLWSILVSSLRARRNAMRTLPPLGENERAFSTRLVTTCPRRES